MLAKIAVTLIVLAAAWVLLFRRPPRRRQAGTQGGGRPALALRRCPNCGIWRLPDTDCRCGNRPGTPAPRQPDRGDDDAAG